MYNDFMGPRGKPFYMSIMDGNYAVGGGSPTFVADARSALTRLTERDVQGILTVPHWRFQLTGAWFCGMKRWTSHAASFGAELLAGETMHAGQGYCFALARFANDESARLLIQYLEIFLRRPELLYDQDWALGALSWIDRMRATNSATRFLEAGGLWDSFSFGKCGSWSSEESRAGFAHQMEFTATAFDA